MANGKARWIPIPAGFQVTMMLLATTHMHYPDMVILKNGEFLLLIEKQGHPKAMVSLAIA